MSGPGHSSLFAKEIDKKAHRRDPKPQHKNEKGVVITLIVLAKLY